MNELLSVLSDWLVDVLVLGTLLLTVGCLGLVLLRQAAARIALARGTVLGLGALCILTALPFWPRQSLETVFSTRAMEQDSDNDVTPESTTGPVYPSPLIINSPLPTDDQAVAVPATTSFSVSKFVKLLPIFWLGAAGCALAYILVGAWRAFRLLRTATKPPAWTERELESLIAPKSRTPRLKTSERIATAAALFAWRPYILLAARSVSEENRSTVRAALAHEWAHIRHGDLWLLALERLLLPVFCLHPFFWLLRRQIRIDQELLADAAAAGDAPVEYAQALLSWAKAETNQAAPFGIAALSLWEHPSSLVRRVEMLLHPYSSAAAGTPRLWRWLAPMSLLTAVLGLSLVTLRPAAVAQDDAIIEIEIQPRPEKIKKARREKPRKSEVNRIDDQIPLPVEAGEIILMEMLVGQVEHAALERAESSLGDLIQAASEDHCRLEGNLIVADLSAEQFSKLTDELKKANALTILSRPRVTTIDGQEASLQIGSSVPLVRLEKTVNGDQRRRVDFQNVGEMIVICPHTSDKDPLRLTLDVTATHTELDKKAELRTGDDTPRFTKHQIKLAVEASVGKTLVVTEREPKKGSGRVHSILLAIGPQKLARPAPEPAPPAATKANRAIGAPGNGNEKFRFTGDGDRLTIFENATRVVEFPLGVSKVLVKDPDILRVVPVSPKSITVSGLKPGTTQLSVWSGSDKPSSIEIVISNDLDGLRDENEELRKQIDDLQAKLVDLQAQVRWLRDAAAPGGGKEKVSDEVFLRRVYLDLAGAVPTAEETREFLKDQDKQKRDRLIDKLLEKKVYRDPDEAMQWKEAISGNREAKPAPTKPAPEANPEVDSAKDSIHIFRLSHSSADEVAPMLAKVFPKAEGLEVAVEERTNSLIIRATLETLEKVKSLLEVLDRKVEPKADQKEPAKAPAKDRGALLREADMQRAQVAYQAAKAKYERLYSLQKEESVSELDLEGARQEVRIADFRVEAAKGVVSIKLHELALERAEGELRLAVLAHESAENLAAKGLLSKDQLQEARAAVEKKKAYVSSAKTYLLNAFRVKH